MTTQEQELQQQEELTLLGSEHSKWLTHPITQMLLGTLNKQRDSFVRTISNDATTDIEGLRLRAAANGIKTIDTILLYTTNTEKFIEQNKKPIN